MIQPTSPQQAYPQPAGANAVSINIYNPQAYGGAAQQAATQAVNPDYTNSLYQMPTASMYQQPQQEAYYQQFMPMQSPIQQPMPPQLGMFPSPAPQLMPDSVMGQPQIDTASQIQDVNNQTPQVEEIQEPSVTVDVDGLVNSLKSTDANQQAEAINKIAEHAQDNPEIALQVVSEPVMNSLVDIINQDTSSLEGPSEQQIAVAEKVAKGEQLTPEEDALSEQLSPRDAANKNRIFALYTLAMIQKLQKDELAQYIETQQQSGQEAINPLKAQDLIGYDNMVNIVNSNNERPEVKVAAIQALTYVADSQDAQSIKDVLANSLKSSDEAVKAAAQEASDKLDGIAQAQ